MSTVDSILNVFSQQAFFLVALFLGVIMTAAGGIQLFRPSREISRRLQNDVSSGSARLKGIEQKKSEPSAMVRFLAGLAKRPANSRKSDKSSRLRLRLIRAGFRGSWALEKYYILRIVLGLGLPIGIGSLVVFFVRDLTIENLTYLVVALTIIGIIAPTLYLGRRIKDRRTSVREGFPDALDLLLVCVEAGLGLDAAINRVAVELVKAHPILGEEFGLMGLELRAGKTREDALRNMASRLDVDEVATLSTLLIQSDQLGSSIALALRVHADEMRVKRMLTAEERANKLPVKLSVPLVFCILPALLLVILAPAIINIGRNLLPMLNLSGLDVMR